MWKDWLERTLTGNKVPVMLASEIMCEPANGNHIAPAAKPEAAARAHADKSLSDEPHTDKVPEPA
jgi:hypothetical protein